jgi:subtilisin family serine protease
MPPHSLVRRPRPLAVALLAAAAFVLAVGPASASSPQPQEQLLVKFRSNAQPQAQARLIARVGARQQSAIRALRVHVLHIRATRAAQALRLLRHSPLVAFAERNANTAQRFDTLPNDNWWPNEWSQVKVEAPKAWDLSRGSASTTVAILDTGVDPSQPDLQGSFVAGWNTIGSTPDTTDTDGHGTLSAGVAVARGNNAIGIASYCWSCSLMPVKVIDSGGAGSFASVANGITWATDHGARVISMSLGFTSSSNTLQSAVQYAHSRNVVIVAAAGNYGTSNPIYPAAYSQVLSTAGTDSNDALYSWSNFGSWVKLSAPGCNFATGKNAWYGTFCGTSSAAPALAGVAALAVSYAPLASNTTIEQALESTASPVAGVQYGRVDAYKTLLALGGGSTPPPPPPPPTGSAPANTSAPTIAGTPQSEQTLAGGAGVWSGTTPLTFAYQWNRCDAAGVNCSAISSATATSYLVTSADVAATIRLVVTASNAYGSATSTSTPTAAVTGLTTPPPATVTTTLTGALNSKQSAQRFQLAVGNGSAQSALAFSKCSSLALDILRPDGSRAGTANGPSVLALVQTLAAGTYTLQVSGSVKGSCPFTLNVTYATP